MSPLTTAGDQALVQHGRLWAADDLAAEKDPLALLGTRCLNERQAVIAADGSTGCQLALPLDPGSAHAAALGLGIQATAAAVEWWAPGPGGFELAISRSWYGALPRFAAISRHVHFPHGSGLPGRAWALAAPIMVNDLRRCPRFLRGSGAENEGLRQGLAIPVVSGHSLHGVLLLLSAGEDGIAPLVEQWSVDGSGQQLARCAYLGGRAHASLASGDHLRLGLDHGGDPLIEAWRSGRPCSAGPTGSARAHAMASDGLSQLVAIPFQANGQLRSILLLGW